MLHALDRGFRCQAGGDRLLHPPDPALIVGEHPIGFEHIAMLAGPRHIVIGQHGVDGFAELDERIVEARLLRLDVFGEKLGDGHARLVQDDMAERDALRHCDALDGLALRAPGLWRGDVEALQDIRHHLRSDHGDGLQDLDLLLRIGSRDRVLHGEHADGASAADHGHPEEGLIDLFAGFRAIGIGGVIFGVRQVHVLAAARHEADETLAGLHMRGVNRFLAKAFGGEQLEGTVRQPDVDRADFRDHIGRDQSDDPVETRLNVFLLALADAGTSHDFAQLSQ